MKRPTQLIALCLFIAFFGGIVSWYWLRQETEGIDSPAVNRPIEAPPKANTNLAANPPPVTVIPQGVNLPTGPQPQREVVGIGAVIVTDSRTGALMIKGTVPNSPAAAAGLSGNFLIRKIDDVATDGMKLADGVGLIRGPAGSKVRLELFDLDANEAKTVELTRQKLQL